MQSDPLITERTMTRFGLVSVLRTVIAAVEILRSFSDSKLFAQRKSVHERMKLLLLYTDPGQESRQLR